MNERLSHSNQIEINHVPHVPIKDIIIVTTAVGIFYGTGAGLIWGPQVGTEVGIGLASFGGGILLGIESSNKAAEFAREGKKVRAYLKALESTLETAILLAVAGATAGFGIAGPEGAIWGAVAGTFIGEAGHGQITMHLLSEAFRQRHQISGKIALS